MANAERDWRTIDYFADPTLLADPYDYFDDLRSECPVLHLPHLNVVAVTGYDEISEAYRDPATFSSCNALMGPFTPFPEEPPESDDISDFIARNRHHLPLHEHMVTMDPPDHDHERALMMRLITPKRLKDNEGFLVRLADQQLDEVLPAGRCEFISGYSQPYAMLAVADLLGVPEEDHERFREGFGLSQTPGELGVERTNDDPLGWLDSWFAEYIEDRRKNPRKDVLTDLALATYPDGSVPEVVAVVRTATFLFAAGQETTARLLAAALMFLGQDVPLQDKLRDDLSLIPGYIEEVLRLESPVKTDFRLAQRSTTLGGVDIPAGTALMMLNGAANRDPRRFACPHELRLDRPNAQAHIAFGRGVHSCPGGPLARAEGRVTLERLLQRTTNIRLSEQHHGPVGERRFTFAPTFLLRGLSELHLEFDGA